MKRKRFLSLLLTLTILPIQQYLPAGISISPIITASAAGNVDSGTCGKQAKWTLDSDGTLTISGSGAIYDYEWDSSGNFSRPWDTYVEKQYGTSDVKYPIRNITVGENITVIGENAFALIRSLETVTILNPACEIRYSPTIDQGLDMKERLTR